VTPAIPPRHDKNHRFEQDLLDDLPTTRPQRNTNGEFLLPGDAAREQKPRHIHASDEQNACDGGKK